jgi:hypothetical protein
MPVTGCAVNMDVAGNYAGVISKNIKDKFATEI